MLAIFLLFQNSAPTFPTELLGPGASAGVAGLVLYFWRLDRQVRDAAQKASDDRYSALATDFRSIVQDNTKAMQQLADAISQKTPGGVDAWKNAVAPSARQ